MKRFLFFLMVCFLPVLAIAEELPREEQLRVLILEARTDIADQQVCVAAAEAEYLAALQAENDVWSRMPWSMFEAYGAMANTTAACKQWYEQITSLQSLQGTLVNYQAELNRLLE